VGFLVGTFLVLGGFGGKAIFAPSDSGGWGTVSGGLEEPFFTVLINLLIERLISANLLQLIGSRCINLTRSGVSRCYSLAFRPRKSKGLVFEIVREWRLDNTEAMSRLCEIRKGVSVTGTAHCFLRGGSGCHHPL
jgi:hypothetical protein